MERHIFLGVDTGKNAHYAEGVDQVGKTVHQQAVANDEAGLRALVEWAVDDGGRRLVILDNQHVHVGPKHTHRTPL
jgi:hypothetical protein